MTAVRPVKVAGGEEKSRRFPDGKNDGAKEAAPSFVTWWTSVPSAFAT